MFYVRSIVRHCIMKTPAIEGVFPVHELLTARYLMQMNHEAIHDTTCWVYGNVGGRESTVA